MLFIVNICFWKERTKMSWFKDGDRNTVFFFMLWSKGEIILVARIFDLGFFMF